MTGTASVPPLTIKSVLVNSQSLRLAESHSILRALPKAQNVGAVAGIQGGAGVALSVQTCRIEPPRMRRVRLERNTLRQQRRTEAQCWNPPPMPHARLGRLAAHGGMNEGELKNIALRG